MLIALTSESVPDIAVAGGKGRALVELTQAGFNVPPGTILSTAFFEPWRAAVLEDEAWPALEQAYASARGTGGPDLAALATALKERAASLELGAAQRQALDSIHATAAGARLAVRSSSPEEDLAGASFAGLYETVLDVASNDLEAAVRVCFLSCLDARVFAYKQKMGFADPRPSIAVVVQRMVASDTSGVAFSLNPLTNDFDEMLVNAHRGLGEALVAGEITPDAFVVDKVSGALVEQRPASLEDGACLDAPQLRELLAATAEIEAHYRRPMDVEWAFAGGGSNGLHILQARPITAYVPLAAALQTAPGEPRVLYIDRALTDGLTMSAPISPLTNDFVSRAATMMVQYLFDVPDDADLTVAGLCLQGSRIYLNLSLYLHLMRNREALARQISQMSTLLAEMIGTMDIDRYRPAEPPEFLRLTSLLRHAPKALWRLRGVFGALLKPIVRYRALPPGLPSGAGRVRPVACDPRRSRATARRPAP